MIAAAVIAACSWNAPGHNPYIGRVPAAIEHYVDIPAEVRAKLRARMTDRQYDEVATIRRDTIEGPAASYTELRDMHFGRGTVCRAPDRSSWTDSMVERGLVYCESGHCIIVPTVCRNVSRVTRLAALKTPAPAATLAGLQPLGAAPTFADASELSFEAPGAGPMAEPAPTFAAAAASPRLETALMSTPLQPWAGPVLAPPVPTIPEPPTILLSLVGIAWLAWLVRKAPKP